jgi:hypothetical protein
MLDALKNGKHPFFHTSQTYNCIRKFIQLGFYSA